MADELYALRLDLARLTAHDVANRKAIEALNVEVGRLVERIRQLEAKP